jgi:outer membrane protein
MESGVRIPRVVLAVTVALVATLAGAGERSAWAQQPLTMEQAVTRSLEGNDALRTAWRGLDGARAQVREAWGNVLPNVHFSGSYTRNLDIPQFFLPARFLDPSAPEGAVVPVQAGTDNAWFAQARADQPLFNAAAFLGVGAADRYASYEEEVVRGEAQQVVTRTRLRYYDVLLAQEQLRLTEESVARVEQVLDETRKLYRAGLASEYDVLRLEVELSNLEPNLRRSANAMASARRGLAVEMGVDSVAGDLAGSLLTLELPPLPGGAGGEHHVGPTAGAMVASTAGAASVRIDRGLLLDRAMAAESLPVGEAVAVAWRYRSDLRQLAAMRELRQTERRVEMSQYLPKVSLFGTWTVNAQGDDRPTFFGDNRFSTRAVGVQVDVPLFSGLQRPARISRMGAVVQQLESQLSYARDQASNEVTTLRDQVLESHARVLAQRRAVSQAGRGWDIVQAEYRAGTAGRLQVTDAELALRQSEFNYAQAVHDYLTAQARLDLAIGRVPLVDEGHVLAIQDQTGER